MEVLNPLGLPQVLVILTLIAFALWKRGWLRSILSICLIVWGAFAFQHDVKIAAPLLAIGTVLFIMSTLNLIGKGVSDNG